MQGGRRAAQAGKGKPWPRPVTRCCRPGPSRIRPRPSPQARPIDDERLRLEVNEVYAGRKVETQTRLAREMREGPMSTAHDPEGMAELPAPARGEHRQARREVPRHPQGQDPRRPPRRCPGRPDDPMAARMARARATLDAVTQRGVRPRPPVGRPPPGVIRGFPRFRPARAPDRRGPGRPRLPRRAAASADPRLMEGIATAGTSPPCSRSPTGRTCWPRPPPPAGPPRSACSRRRCSGS